MKRLAAVYLRAQGRLFGLKMTQMQMRLYIYALEGLFFTFFDNFDPICFDLIWRGGCFVPKVARSVAELAPSRRLPFIFWVLGAGSLASLVAPNVSGLGRSRGLVRSQARCPRSLPGMCATRSSPFSKRVWSGAHMRANLSFLHENVGKLDVLIWICLRMTLIWVKKWKPMCAHLMLAHSIAWEFSRILHWILKIMSVNLNPKWRFYSPGNLFRKHLNLRVKCITVQGLTQVRDWPEI